MSKDLVGYMNPFPDLGARIPDGQVASSLPHRFTNVQEFIIPETKIGHMLIFPGANAGCMTFTTNPDGSSPDDIFYYVYSNDDMAPGFDFPSPGDSTYGLGEGTISNTGDLTKWRVVSQGLRMAYTAPDENNGGWFESCQLHYKLDLIDWELFSPTANHTGGMATGGSTTFVKSERDDAYLRPRVSMVGDILNIQNSLAESEGYRCGTLRSVAATAFTLPVFQGNHHFQTLDERYRVEKGGIEYDNTIPVAPGLGVAPIQLNFKPGLNECKDYVESQWDQSHDILYVRIHPSASTSTPSADNLCRLLVQHVANHECIYDIRSTLHKHMLTAPGYHAGFPKAKNKKGGAQGSKDPRRPTPMATGA